MVLYPKRAHGACVNSIVNKKLSSFNSVMYIIHDFYFRIKQDISANSMVNTVRYRCQNVGKIRGPFEQSHKTFSMDAKKGCRKSNDNVE